MDASKIIRIFLTGSLLLTTIFPDLAFAYGQNDYYGTPDDTFGQAYYWQPLIDASIQILIAVAIGALFGVFFSHKLRNVRKWFIYAIILVVLLATFYYFETVRLVLAFFIAFGIALHLLRDRTPAPTQQIRREKLTTFGSAEWATLEHLEQHGVINNNGLFLGDFEEWDSRSSLNYTGDRHLLTVAPTRSGKGVSSIIPNLLTYQGSVLVIDPKGENARVTAMRRGANGLGQTVHIVDPWGITGAVASCFNPLDWLSADDEDISENAMMLADSMITPRGGNADHFWDDEAKALLMGIILYVALDSYEQGQRTLGRVRDIIVSDSDTLNETLIRMGSHPNNIINSTAARTISKEDKLRASVLASLQSHTHFLDSPRIRENLSRSDFQFEELKSSKMTVYLVLPADRLETFGRWLRLLVQQAITVNARNIAVRPDKPILFLLDEMAALGRLTMVEQAYGLMAGFGMQLWGIVQDLSQLERIYDKGWETFIGNSGVLQYFGSRDQKTAEYFSKLCGVTTIEKLSFGNAIATCVSYVSSLAGGSSTSSTTRTFNSNRDVVQRQLAFPDELMVMRDGKQLVFIENSNPIQGKKALWFDDPRFKTLGANLHE
ncbi:MAG: type IV secretory system conjugative DNA transfer family protein [Methylococcales bacterium]|nr:type IV secretory system conjugative DNA transfer family protein [Methylococcales bacterium]